MNWDPVTSSLPPRSSHHAQKFPAEFRIVAEAAEHAACDQIGVGLMHTASGHAVMRGFDQDGDTARLEGAVHRVGYLRRQPLLDLKALGVDFHHSSKLADADHAIVGNISYPR